MLTINHGYRCGYSLHLTTPALTCFPPRVLLFPFNYFFVSFKPSFGFTCLLSPLICRWPFPSFNPSFCGVEHAYFWKDFFLLKDYLLWLVWERNCAFPLELRVFNWPLCEGHLCWKKRDQNYSSLVWWGCQAWVVVSCLHLVYKTI